MAVTAQRAKVSSFSPSSALVLAPSHAYRQMVQLSPPRTQRGSAPRQPRHGGPVLRSSTHCSSTSSTAGTASLEVVSMPTYFSRPTTSDGSILPLVCAEYLMESKDPPELGKKHITTVSILNHPWSRGTIVCRHLMTTFALSLSCSCIASLPSVARSVCRSPRATRAGSTLL